MPACPPEPRKRATAELEAFVEIHKSCGAKLALTSSNYSWAKKAAALTRLSKGAWPADLRWCVCDISKSSGGMIPDAPPGGEVAFLQREAARGLGARRRLPRRAPGRLVRFRAVLAPGTRRARRRRPRAS